MLFALLVLVMQFSDPIGSVPLRDAVFFWVGRIAAVLVSLWIAMLVVESVPFARLAPPHWFSGTILFPVIATVPMAIAESVLESRIPQVEAFDDSALRAASPLLALATEYLTILSVVLPINVLLWIVIDQRRASGNAPDLQAEGEPEPQFLAKTHGIELNDVVAIAAEEHYVRVYTSDDSELVYARFGDVVKQMPDDAGLQVHRSWWVAGAAIKRAIRGARRYTLELSNGSSVPVSDSYVRSVRERGLLRRR